MSEDVLDNELDTLLSAESEVVSDSVSFEPDKPHWSVSRDEMLKLLRIVQTFPAKSTIFLAVWKEDNYLHLHANNKDAVLESVIPISNASPFETDKVYFLDSKMLLTFIQNYSSFVFSFDEKGNIYFESPYSVYQLEVFNLSLKDVRIELPKDTLWTSYPLTRFQTNVFKQLFAFAASLNDNKVFILNNEVKANFTLYQHSIQVKTDIPEELIIRRIDIPSISEIADGDVSIGVSKNRISFKFNLGELSFLKIPYNSADYMFPETYALGDTVGEFQVDVKMLRRALKLTGVLSSPVVDFKSEESCIYLYAGEKAKFKVGTGELKEDFSMSTELFTKIVATVDPSEMFVSVKVTEKGLDLTIEKDHIITYSMSKTTVGQMKRQDKLAKKQERRVERKAALADAGKLSENKADTVDKIDDLFDEGLE